MESEEWKVKSLVLDPLRIVLILKDGVLDPLNGNAPRVGVKENTASRLLVQQRLVQLILCILYIHVQ